MRASVFVFGWVLLGVVGCRSEQEVGQAPPEVIRVNPPSNVALCKDTVAEFAHVDLRGVLSPKVEDFCVDPNSAPRAYGQDGEGNMDEVCTELFNGECELYKAFGLLRVTTARYVRDDGSSALVAVNVSRFGGSEGALAFFSRRVLSDQDPKSTNLRAIEGMKYAALGSGVAYAQSGPLVIEAVYVNDDEPPAAIRTTSERLLPEFLRTLAARETILPKAVALLPEAHRLPFGVGMEPKDAFGVRGLGAAATGYYDAQGKRYRVAVSESVDEAAAKDVYAGARRLPGHHGLKEAPFDAFELRQVDADGPVVWWLIGKHGARVVAVSDEPWALRGATPEEQQHLSLDRAAKFEVMRRVFRAK